MGLRLSIQSVGGVITALRHWGGLGRNDSVGPVVLSALCSARASWGSRDRPSQRPHPALASSCERIRHVLAFFTTESSRLGWIAVCGLLLWVKPVSGQTVSSPTASTAPAPTLWSLRPVVAPPVPPPSPGVSDSSHPIDRFIDEALHRQGLHRAPEAERHLLIRRVAWDLTGLPPTPSEVATYLSDSAPEAFERMVERFLASPAYGERWGRWWLDLARYADTNGQDENKVMANAWRYRDWVIRSFNANQPYDHFVREQLAGDLLPAAGVSEAARFDRWVATGFLVLGPKMLAEQDKPKLVMDLVDEQIDVVGRAFLGLTLSCARCHDHKFDPVSAEDYYALAGIFRSTKTLENLAFVSKFNERRITGAERMSAIEKHQATSARLKQEHEAAIRAANDGLLGDWKAALVRELPQWNDPSRRVATNTLEGRWKQWWQGQGVSPGVRRTLEGLAKDAPARQAWLAPRRSGGEAAGDGSRWAPGRVGSGFQADGRNHLDRPHSPELEPKQWTLQTWVYVDAFAKEGDSRRWLVSKNDNEWAEGHYALVLDGKHPMAYLNIGGGPDRVVSVRSARPVQRREWHHLVATYDGKSLRLFVDGSLEGQLEVGRARVPGVGRFALARRPDGYVHFKGRLDEVLLSAEVWTPERVKEAFERPERTREWPAVVRFGFDPVGESERREAEWAEAREAVFGEGGVLALPKDPQAFYPESVRSALAQREQEQEALRRQDPGVPEFALSVDEGTVADLPVHIRGSHLQLASHPVPRGFPKAIRVGRAPTPEAHRSGRWELADWLTRSDHPLTARVFVNRVWQAHFGQGLVRSSDNFGTRGDAPTHPGLLDWLARDLVDQGWDLKRLHRQILASATWRQAGRIRADPKGPETDPENRWLWHHPRQRLEAEMIRDGVLAVSGRLDRSLGGTLVSWKNDEYTPQDEVSESSRRRTVYLPVVRDRVYDVLTLFDFANPSVGVARRTPTVVSHQALFWMNSPWVKEQARALAGDLGSGQRASVAQRVAQAYERVLGRTPDPAEQARAVRFLTEAATTAAPPDSADRWTSWCQVLLASSEFQYRD